MREPGRQPCGRGIRAALVAVASAAGALASAAGEFEAGARLAHPRERAAMVRAIRGAADLLGRNECQGLLDEFTDASGQSLRSAVLRARAGDARDYLGQLFFYDAPEAACDKGSVLAGSRVVGSRVVRVCGRQLVAVVADNARWAEAVVIHEMLHSLGLGENPPSSDHITRLVLARCRR